MAVQWFLPKSMFQILVLLCLLASSVDNGARADGHNAEADGNLSPATPYEFVQMYSAASEAKSSPGVAGLYSNVLVSIPFKGEMSIMTGFEEQRLALDGLFADLKARGINAFSLADYTITKVSNDFAFARLRWELKTAPDSSVNTIMSTYVIRLEDDGWRAVSILEMGTPHAP